MALALSASAEAGTVLSLINNGLNQISDENREYLIDRVGTVKGQIDVGDSFRGGLNFNTLNSGSANLGGLTANNELSGVFQALVSAVDTVKVGTNFITTITFVPDPVFEAVYGAGAMLVLFEDPTKNAAMDFNDPAPAGSPPADPTPGDKTAPLDDGTGAGPRTVPPSSADVSTGANVTEEAFVATATNGTRFITLGFKGVAGEGAELNAISKVGFFTNVLAAFTVTSGTSLANANLGLNRLDGAGPETMDPFIFGPTASPFGGTVDVAASVNLKGVSDLDTPFELASNLNASFNGRLTPEPGSMVLLGMGAMSVLGAGYRRRRNAAKQQAV